ncbi:uncharacterized protein METZ01_LOCUS206360 [marine metagenome]|uniref:Enoyl-CoA hydratase n=1 Tax=marine metagenome TaxID=408172 RepID=A0A382ERS8_9ZZZZ
MSYSELLQLNKSGDGVAQLTLNRPEDRNALSLDLRTNLTDCLVDLSHDPTIDAVLLSGAGEVFCAGFDLKELNDGDATQIFAAARRYHHVVHTFRKPIIAAVNGPAMAGGMDLACMCDIRLGCSNSQFGQPQVRMGISAAYDLLRSITDESTARYLCLTGNKLSATEAFNRGLLSALYNDGDELRDAALSCAAAIAKAKSGKAMKVRFLAEQPNLYD